MGFSTNTGAGGQLPGVMFVKPEHRSQITLQKVTQNGVQLRIYPELNADGQPMPLRFGPEKNDVGNWVNGDHYGISYLGGGDAAKEKITTLLTIDGDEKIKDPSQRRGLRLWDRFRKNVYFRIEDGTAPPHWARYTVQKRGAVLGQPSSSKAKPFCFFFGLMTWLMTEKGPAGWVSNKKPRLNCLFYGGTNAQNALVELVMKKNPDAENVTTDEWVRIFQHELQIVDLQNGCLINFGKPGRSDPSSLAQPQGQQADVNFSVGTAQTSERDDDTYAVEATIGPKCPVPLGVVRDNIGIRKIADVLQTYADERALLAAIEVGFPDDLIIDAFRDEPSLLSDRLRQKKDQMDSQAASGGRPASEYAAPARQDSAPQQSGALPPGGPVDFGGVDTPENPGTSQVNQNDVPWDRESTGQAQPPQQQQQASSPSPAEGASADLSIPDAATPDGGTNTGQPSGIEATGLDEMKAALAEATGASEES